MPVAQGPVIVLPTENIARPTFKGDVLAETKCIYYSHLRNKRTHQHWQLKCDYFFPLHNECIITFAKKGQSGQFSFKNLTVSARTYQLIVATFEMPAAEESALRAIAQYREGG